MSPAITATAQTRYARAEKPTMYFVGVTTGQSAIMRVFPLWAEHLKLGDVTLQGLDCRPRETPDVYRRIVEHIRDDPLSRGALVTTHKIDLLKACHDLFDELDPHACLLGEVGAISKRQGKLLGHAVDSTTGERALQAFLPRQHWQRTTADVFILGSGGAAVALSCTLMDPKKGTDRPAKIIVSDRDPLRLQAIGELHARMGAPILAEYHLTPMPQDNDAIVSRLPRHSVVINATGLGKDGPGSPITAAAVLPQGGYAWDLNYRGELLFLQQARAQQSERHLQVEDGWVYFVHGWTCVIGHVFDIDMPVEGTAFEDLSRLASQAR